MLITIRTILPVTCIGRSETFPRNEEYYLVLLAGYTAEPPISAFSPYLAIERWAQV